MEDELRSAARWFDKTYGAKDYAEEAARLRTIVEAHLETGGIAIVEPWFTFDAWQEGMLHMLLADEPELKVARLNTSCLVDGVSVNDLHHLIGRPSATRPWVGNSRTQPGTPYVGGRFDFCALVPGYVTGAVGFDVLP